MNTNTCLFQVLSVKTTKADVDGSKPAMWGAWLEVTLPDNWNLRRSSVEDIVWYRIDWQRICDGGKVVPAALVLHSIQIAGEIYVNDQQLWRDQHLSEPLSRSWNMPRYWQIPKSYLRKGINTIWIKAISVPGQPIGIGRIYLGDPSEMQTLHDRLIWNSRSIILVNIILIFIMAILLFFIWIANRKQSAYGLYAIAALFWLFFLSYFVTNSPWPFSTTYMSARVNTIALLLAGTCFSLFILRFSKQRLVRVEFFFWVVIISLITLSIFINDVNIVIAQTAAVVAITLIILFSCLQTLIYGIRHKLRYIIVVSLAWFLALISYIHDLLRFLNMIDSPVPLSAYVVILVTLLMICLIGWRHAHYTQQIASFNEELSESIARAKSELSAVLKQEYALSMENVRLQDRLQIANDLHDGLGGSLVHMMASIEMTKSHYSPKEVIAMLSLIRNDLRQAIDSSSSQSVKVPETPNEWLAPVRHRYSTLFDELGVEFKWNIEQSWLIIPTAIQCLALTRLIEEALTNIIKHSHAHFVEISLKLPKCDELILIIEDDGLGFDVEAVAQSGMSIGMRSMKMRISRVGGSLDVTSTPGKTRLIATLKL
ncbi:ATP-binding protein [Bartonella sp. HY329]|uniref:sensor histidine kinase n=1 Tax=unclassified Bartonella TaxID=2645622 RepID=UPI0021C5BB82|nr:MULTISPECIES: 7TM diverse intracellular signaling domain-containing protein [unclassified Bartonella]UXM96303.1 ATP-binding protein [Bartonella sp. HY329]UXN10627.1 ATP-binding protein [Bartonella sp. HY328]